MKVRQLDIPRAIAVFLLCLPYVGLTVWLHRAQDWHSIAGFWASVGVLQLLIAFAAGTWRRFLLLQFPLVMLDVAFCVYTLTYNIPPGRAIAFVLQSTSWAEVRGFLSIWQGARLALAAIVFALAYLVAAWLTPSSPIARGPSRVRWALIVLIILMSAYGARSSAALIDGIAVNPVLGTVLFVNGPLHEARTVMSGTAVKKVPYHAAPVATEEVHILIIGESARRDSWSVYGYGRRTTPFLEQLRGEAIFFQNAVADANLTVCSVPILLTGAHPASYDASAVTGNLVDLAHEAGYFTSWLINQDPGPSLLVGTHADRMVYPSALKVTVLGHQPLDEELLPPLSAAIGHNGVAQFIGLHTMGSHWEYYYRYPPSFGRFGAADGLNTISAFNTRPDQRVVNAYDNSVGYTDWFLGQVIAEARKLSVPATVTYFADHGEDLTTLDGSAGHGGPSYSKHQYEIPAFVWANPAYREAHPQKIRALIGNSTRLIRTHNVFYSVADLMGIHWPGEKPSESFASEAFVPDLSSQYLAGGVLVTRPQ